MAKTATNTDPFELVRVRDSAQGSEYTTRRLVAEADPKRYTVLDEPAVNRDGRPLPSIPGTPKTPSAPANQS